MFKTAKKNIHIKITERLDGTVAIYIEADGKPLISGVDVPIDLIINRTHMELGNTTVIKKAKRMAQHL